MTGFGYDITQAATGGPPPAPPRDPAAGPELRPYDPSLADRFFSLFPGNRAKAANEYAARQIAKEKGISVDQVYRDAGGSRPMFNPEGRPPVQAAVQAGAVLAEEVPQIPRAVVNSGLRAIRGGDIQGAQDQGILDRAITKTSRPPAPPTQDRNYDSFRGVGDSLGYSLTTMVSSAIAGAGATAASGGNPLAGVAGGMAASGTVAYRASKDDFLNRLRDNLNDQAKKLYGRPLNDQEWNQARQDFDAEAMKYGAWEAVPEAISNAIFLKAFRAPAAGASSSRLASLTQKAASQLAEQGTETITALGQNKPELRAGLTTDELNVADAFKQQFVQSLVTSGTMAGGMKAKQLATDFYNNQVLPRFAPDSALAKAIQADIEALAAAPARAPDLDTAQRAPAPPRPEPVGPWTVFQAPPPARPQSPEEPPEQPGVEAAAQPPVAPPAAAPVEPPAAPAVPAPGAADRPTAPNVMLGLIDVENGYFMGQRQAAKEWQIANGLVEVRNNEPVLTAKGQQLLNQLRAKPEAGQRGMTTEEAEQLITSFLGLPEPGTPMLPSAAEPAAVEPPAPTPMSVNRFGQFNSGDEVELKWGGRGTLNIDENGAGTVDVTEGGQVTRMPVQPGDILGMSRQAAAPAPAPAAPATAPVEPEPTTPEAIQSRLDRGDFIGREDEDEGPAWSDSREPATEHSRRRYMIQTPKGNVQVDLDLNPRGWGYDSKLWGLSVSETGFRSVISDSAVSWANAKDDPYGFALKLVSRYQENHERDMARGKGLKRGKRAAGKSAPAPAPAPVPAPAPAPEPVAAPAPAEPTSQAGDTADIPEDVLAKLRDIVRLAAVAERKLASGDAIDLESAVAAYRKALGTSAEEAAKLLDNTLKTVQSQAKDKVFDAMLADYIKQFDASPNSDAQLVAAIKNGSFDISDKPYAQAAYELYKIDPAKIERQATAEGQDAAVQRQLQRFQAGIFSLMRVSGNGAQGRDVAQQQNEREGEIYAKAAKLFLEGPLTAKVPGKKDASLDIQDLDNIQPQPIPKNIPSKGADTFAGQRKALDAIAAQDDIRFYLKGVLIDKANNRLVATDGHKLALINDPNLDGAPSVEGDQGILGRDDKFIEGRYPDIDRVVPAKHPGPAYSFNSAELGNQARGIEKAWRYVGTHLGAPMMFNIGGRKGGFDASYVAAMTDFFRRLGYDGIQLSLADGGNLLYAQSPDGKAKMVIMGLRDPQSIFAPILPQGDRIPGIETAAPAPAPAPKKPRTPRKKAGAQSDQASLTDRIEAQADAAELDDGAATDTAERPRGQAAGDSAGLADRGQADEGSLPGAGGTASPSPNTRGTRVGRFVQAVSFTNRESFFRQAFRDAGLNPAQANNLPIERQFNILAGLLERTFGLKFVDKTPNASNRKAVDELLDLYRNLQFMTAALELPLKAIGLDGTLGVVSMEKQKYFAVYYPQGLVLNARGNKNLPEGKTFTGPFVGLPNRTNSFAHEWGHALDFYLQGKFSRLGGAGLSGFIRDNGLDGQPKDSETAFKDLIMALFFDQAQIAARVMELERRIATTKSDDVREKLQKQLDAIRAGNTMVSDRSEYYRKVQQLGADAYYLKPTEMIARSFETFISGKVEGLGGSTEAITKSVSAYGNEAVEYMQQAYPQQAERDKINLAWQNLIDALRAESILGKPGDQVAQVPGNTDIIDPNEMLKLSEDSRSIIQRELDAWREFKAEARRNDLRAKNPKSLRQRYEDAMSGFLWSERGALLTLMDRYPRSQGIREVVRRLTTDPGSSRLNNRLTFEEDVDRRVKIFSTKVGEIIKRHELDKLEPEQMESLRRILVSQPDGKETPELVEAADKIRNLFNEAWYYGDNAGLKMGYALNAYLPRMVDMTRLVTDPDGFMRAAGDVYQVMFDTKYENYDQDEDVLRGLLGRGIRIAKLKRFPPKANGLTDDEKELLGEAVKQYKAAAAAAKAAEREQDDPDAAQAKALEEMAKAVELAGEVYDAIKRADAELRAATWLQEAWVGAAEQPSSYSPDGDFLKGRVLPPEADVLLKDFLMTDVIQLMQDYIPKLVRRAEYERRFGGTRLGDLKRQMYAEGVLPDDIENLTHILEKLTGRSHDRSMGQAAKAVSTIQAYGIMAMLGRAVLSSVAEPLGAAIQTRDVRSAWESMTTSLAQFLPTATARDREALAAAVGVIGNPYMDQMLSHREGGQFRDDPQLSARMAKYYLMTLQHQWVTKTSIGAMEVSQTFIRNRVSTFQDSTNQAERKRAMRDLAELGLQPDDAAQFMEWMADKTDGDDSLLSGRKLTVDELASDMGQLYAEMLYRMTRKIILDPKPTDTAAFGKSTLGRLIMSIQSFAYTFQRQFLIASAKKIAEEYKSSKDGVEVAKVAGGIALGFASLIAGQTIISALRELMFNPDRWEEEKKNGNLAWYLVKLGVSRAGVYGAWDPIYNMAEGIRYQRDVATTLVGAVPGFVFQALQRVITPFVRNSEKTNTAEYNAVIGAYELAAIPLMAHGITMLPAGPLTAPLIAALYATATSPAAKNEVAETIVGPKDGKRKGQKQELTNY